MDSTAVNVFVGFVTKFCSRALMKNFDIESIEECISNHSEKKSALILVNFEQISVSN